MVDDLRDLMTEAAASGDGDAPGHNIEFVFVSACYSRAAGEAFVKAGVPHVVCCQQDEPIMDLAAIEFSRTLYRALACGWNVGNAFKFALRSVVISPDVPDAQNEVKKFLLLPENEDHSLQLFSNRQGSASDIGSVQGSGSDMMSKTDLHAIQSSYTLSTSSSSSSSWILPPPPQEIVGRELDMYKILSDLPKRRLIKIKGAAGMGKSSLAAALANYVRPRGRSLLIDEVIWLPLVPGGRHDVISASLDELFAIFLENESLAIHLPDDDQYKKVSGRIFEYFQQTKALIIIETRAFLVQNELDKLSFFLNQLFRGTMHTRVLLVGQEGLDVTVRHCTQSEILVDALDFGNTATLFGRLCPHVSEMRDANIRTPRQLGNVLVPKEKAHVKLRQLRRELSKRGIDVFTRIGGGNPANIHQAAMTMPGKEYDGLIALARRLEFSVDCKTRVDLEQQILKFNADLQVAVREENFGRATEVQSALNDLEIHREALPTLEELRETAETLHREIELACSAKDFVMAEALSKDLDGVSSNMKAEEEALAACDEGDAPGGTTNGKDLINGGEKHATRAGLELELRSQREELEKSIALRDFASCKAIQSTIDDLESRRESLPTLSEISHMIACLMADIDSAVSSRDFEAAEMKHLEMQKLEEQATREKESEDSFISFEAIRVGKQLVSLGEELENALKERISSRSKDIEQMIREEIRELEAKFTLDYVPEEVEDTRADDEDNVNDSGDHATNNNNRNEDDDDDYGKNGGLDKDAQDGNHKDTTITSSRGGAFAVAGPNSSSPIGMGLFMPIPEVCSIGEEPMPIPEVSSIREEAIVRNYQRRPRVVQAPSSLAMPRSKSREPPVNQSEEPAAGLGASTSNMSISDVSSIGEEAIVRSYQRRPRVEWVPTLSGPTTTSARLNPPERVLIRESPIPEPADAYAVDTRTEEEVIGRIVQQVLARDMVRAVEVKSKKSFVRRLVRKIVRRKSGLNLA